MKISTATAMVVTAVVLSIAGIEITLILTGYVEEAMNVLGCAALIIGMVVFFLFLDLL